MLRALTPLPAIVLVLVAAVAWGAAALASSQSDRTPTDRLLTRLAIDMASEGEFEPIEMRVDGGAQFAVYDRFRLASLASRAALRAGRPLDAANPPAELLVPRLVILAFARSPLGTDGVRARSIQISGRDGKPVRRLATLTSNDLDTLLPGVAIPPLTLAMSFDAPELRPTDRVAIVFNDLSDVEFSRRLNEKIPGTFSGNVVFTTPEPIDTPPAIVPAGVKVPSAGVEVHVEGVLDLAGRVRYARALDGPPELRPAAVEAVGKWRYVPARMYKAAVPIAMIATVKFGR